MAGATLYIGQLFKNLGDSLTAMIASLTSVNNNVAASVQSVKVIASDNNAVILRATDFSYTGSTAWQEVPGSRIISYAYGTIRIKAQLKNDALNVVSGLGYSKNGGAVTQIGTKTGTANTYSAVTGDIFVALNDYIQFFINENGGGQLVTIQANSLTYSCDTYNPIVSGFITKG